VQGASQLWRGLMSVGFSSTIIRDNKKTPVPHNGLQTSQNVDAYKFRRQKHVSKNMASLRDARTN